MTHSLWILAAGPGALLLAAIAPRTLYGRAGVARLAELAAAFAFGLAVVAWLASCFAAPARTPLIGGSGVGFSLLLDRLSGTMLLLVAFVGWIVVRYSRAYLAGDPGQPRFARLLAATLAAVLLLIMAGNMLQFALAWIATSLGLHGLLAFYRDRPAAILAARKKFLVSRVGDACLIAALLVIHAGCGSLEYVDVIARLQGGLPAGLAAAPVLLALAALLKSAQAPFHGWLVEVMETPTPVSALLHAGIINAGGFLVLRFSGLLALSPDAMHLLAIVGGLTALLGGLITLAQTSVKLSLAYSTMAQMGFMMLECGLGAFSAALLHIVAHSLYKAHAFLSSGGLLQRHHLSWDASSARAAAPLTKAVMVAAAVALTFALGAASGQTLGTAPGVLALGAVLAIGLANLLVNALGDAWRTPVMARAGLTALAVLAAYFLLQQGAAALLAGTVPTHLPVHATDIVVALAVTLGFAAVSVFQGFVAQAPDTPAWRAMHAWVAAGLYVNTLTNQWLHMLWPATPTRDVRAEMRP